MSWNWSGLYLNTFLSVPGHLMGVGYLTLNGLDEAL